VKQIKYLDWDSRFFGFSIGRIELEGLCTSALESAVSEAAANNIECLYLEVPFTQPDVVNYCSENNFLLVDFKTTLSKILFCSESNTQNLTRDLKEAYYPFLKTIVNEVASQGRYVYDPNFGLQKSIMLYEKWLEKSFHKGYCDDFIVSIKNDKPVGFITVRNKEGVPYIDLLGVLESCRGEKIGTALILEAENRLIKSGYKNVKVVTQGHSAKTLRFYQNACFKTENVNVFYHKWLL